MSFQSTNLTMSLLNEDSSRKPTLGSNNLSSCTRVSSLSLLPVSSLRAGPAQFSDGTQPQIR